MEKTLTRSDLSEMIYRKVGLSKTESSALVDEVFTHVSDALVEGNDVKLSSFGTFKLRDKNARIGRNPKTKEEVTIEPRRVLVFKPSQNMKDQMIDYNS